MSSKPKIDQPIESVLVAVTACVTKFRIFYLIKLSILKLGTSIKWLPPPRRAKYIHHTMIDIDGALLEGGGQSSPTQRRADF